MNACVNDDHQRTMTTVCQEPIFTLLASQSQTEETGKHPFLLTRLIPHVVTMAAIGAHATQVASRLLVHQGGLSGLEFR